MDFLLNLTGKNIVDLIIAIGIIAVFYFVGPLFSYVIVKIFNMKLKGEKVTEHAFFLPLKGFIRVLGIYVAILYLKPIFNFSSTTMIWLEKMFRIIVILTIAKALAKNVETKSEKIRKLREKTDKSSDDTSILFIIRITKIVIYIIACFMIVADLGYDLSGIVTGLGLGSVVITLAAQDTIKNFFGGIIIFWDKPFKVGDFIQFGDYSGTVEDITFRSTRVRTLENSIAQIPNAEISSTTVVNLSKIGKRRYTLDLGFVLNTDLERIKKFEQEVLDYLNSLDSVLPETANVAFREIRANDYNVFVYCYLSIVDFAEFLKVKEKINFGIMDIIHRNNLELAYDTKTIEVKNT